MLRAGVARAEEAVGRVGRKRGRQRTTGSHSRWSPEQTSHLGRQSTCFVTRGEGGTRGEGAFLNR